MFLSEQEITQLTGYKKAGYQIRWLRENGIIFRLGVDGKPRILIDHLQKVMGGTEHKEIRKKTVPDFSILQDRSRLKHVS